MHVPAAGYKQVEWVHSILNLMHILTPVHTDQHLGYCVQINTTVAKFENSVPLIQNPSLDTILGQLHSPFSSQPISLGFIL
jgi:hypothetical protein